MAAQASRMAVGWVVRVAEQVFDELLSMETRSSSSLKDEWDQVYAGLSVELFLFLTFSHVAWAGAGCYEEARVS